MAAGSAFGRRVRDALAFIGDVERTEPESPSSVGARIDCI